MYESESDLLDSTSLLDETNSTVDFEAENEVLSLFLVIFLFNKNCVYYRASANIQEAWHQDQTPATANK